MAKKNKIKRIKGWHNLTAGLFLGYRGIYRFKNIKDVWILIKRVFFTLWHGYSPQALWETDSWFIDVMKEILIWHRDNRVSLGFFDYESMAEEENAERTNRVINEMLQLLDEADLPKTEDYEKVSRAKNKFFKLFSKYFYKLYD